MGEAPDYDGFRRRKLWTKFVEWFREHTGDCQADPTARPDWQTNWVAFRAGHQHGEDEGRAENA